MQSLSGSLRRRVDPPERQLSVDFAHDGPQPLCLSRSSPYVLSLPHVSSLVWGTGARHRAVRAFCERSTRAHLVLRGVQRIRVSAAYLVLTRRQALGRTRFLGPISGPKLLTTDWIHRMHQTRMSSITGFMRRVRRINKVSSSLIYLDPALDPREHRSIPGSFSV